MSNENFAKKDAEVYLQQLLSDSRARFKDGQFEAIDAVVNEGKRVLVIQQTGWGKSIVYFISALLLNKITKGWSIIISPLLSLMRNQVQTAKDMGLNIAKVDSTEKVDLDTLAENLNDGDINLLLVSPERLKNEEFVNSVLNRCSDTLRMFVIDEVHCISDWGHDFRPDYRRISSILQTLPSNVPVIATTATANKRVTKDIEEQLGNVSVQRGPLCRSTILLQAKTLSDQGSRLAWLAGEIPKLPGSGIVYASTIRDAENVSDWLVMNKISAQSYHGSSENREELENKLLTNELKVLVATKALGMGFDKPDLGFVIHYQRPENLISYYQMVGRAGRKIDQAYGILLAGVEDEKIQRYFRDFAFPSEELTSLLLALLDESDGLSLAEIKQKLNVKHTAIEKALNFLLLEDLAPIIKDGSKYKKTINDFFYPHEHIEKITKQREEEWESLVGYTKTKTCLMQYLAGVLDDEESEKCGKCINCRGHDIWTMNIVEKLKKTALEFLRARNYPLICKKLIPSGEPFPEYELTGTIPKDLRAERGKILSFWNDSIWGEMVKIDKQENSEFRDDLIDAFCNMIIGWKECNCKWVTCIPSLKNPFLVPNFARKVATKLNLPFIDAVTKVKDNQPQKLQENSFYQCKNLDGVFRVKENLISEPVLLIDDVSDSAWTLTLVSYLLKKNGSGSVYPAVLSTSTGVDKEEVLNKT